MDLDPSILPSIPERKGSLYLRSNHMRYTSGTLNSNWYVCSDACLLFCMLFCTSKRHVDREAEPKDYDIHGIAGNKKKDLQRSTYQQIGNMHEGVRYCISMAYYNYIYIILMSAASWDDHNNGFKGGVWLKGRLQSPYSKKANVWCRQLWPEHNSTRDRHPRMWLWLYFTSPHTHTWFEVSEKPRHYMYLVCPLYIRYLESTQRRDYLYPYTWKPGTAKVLSLSFCVLCSIPTQSHCSKLIMTLVHTFIGNNLSSLTQLTTDTKDLTNGRITAEVTCF